MNSRIIHVELILRYWPLSPATNVVDLMLWVLARKASCETAQLHLHIVRPRPTSLFGPWGRPDAIHRCQQCREVPVSNVSHGEDVATLLLQEPKPKKLAEASDSTEIQHHSAVNSMKSSWGLCKPDLWLWQEVPHFSKGSWLIFGAERIPRKFPMKSWLNLGISWDSVSSLDVFDVDKSGMCKELLPWALVSRSAVGTWAAARRLFAPRGQRNLQRSGALAHSGRARGGSGGFEVAKMQVNCWKSI